MNSERDTGASPPGLGAVWGAWLLVLPVGVLAAIEVMAPARLPGAGWPVLGAAAGSACILVLMLRSFPSTGNSLILAAAAIGLISGVLERLGLPVPDRAVESVLMLALHLTVLSLVQRRGGWPPVPGEISWPGGDMVSLWAARARNAAFGIAAAALAAWVMFPDALAAAAEALTPWTIAMNAGANGVDAVLGLLLFASPLSLSLALIAPQRAAEAAAARLDIHFRGPDSLRLLGNTRTFIFSRAGVLTQGAPAVAAVEPLEGVSRGELLRAAAAVEFFSGHPIARAVLDEAVRSGVRIVKSGDFEAAPGRGARAESEGCRVLVGKPEHLRECGFDTSPIEHVIYRLEHQARTVIAVARDGRVLGALGVEDPLRGESVRTVKTLQSLGMSAVLLTGDRAGTAQIVAEQAGIARVLADAGPDRREMLIERVKRETIHKVAVASCGPAADALFEAADLGIRLGGQGMGDRPEIGLPSGRLDLVPGAVLLVRALRRRIAANLAWVSAFHLALLSPACLGLLPPIAAQMAASALVLIVTSLSRRIAAFDPDRAARAAMARRPRRF